MTLYIIAGANGSGKTTFAKEFSKKQNFEFINADEIAKDLDKDNLTKYKVKAGKIFFEKFKNSLQLDKSFIIETTLSGKYLVKYIEKAKKLNFRVVLIYLFLENPQTNIERIKNRVFNGGHYVPNQDVIRRFYRSKDLFCSIYKDIVSSWSIYYNSNEIFEKIADNKLVFDVEKYNKFKENSTCK
ncbi:MAG: zeta toxin family protein [Campylobacterota bacterium]|nr:zeta toxin family protein [Campylobacterota bacterium]